MTLTEFLLARISDDEERARVVQKWEPPNHRPYEPWALMAEVDEYNLLCVEPSRALAECEAKRRIVAECRAGIDAWPATDNDMHFEWILEALALPYADHPDWRDEWKP